MQVSQIEPPTAAPKQNEELARLKEVTGRVVGSVFYGEMLRAMRESKLKGSFGHGGRGEEVFSAQLHDMLAERMGQSRGNGLSKLLYDRFSHQQSLVNGASSVQGEQS